MCNNFNSAPASYKLFVAMPTWFYFVTITTVNEKFCKKNIIFVEKSGQKICSAIIFD